jgi:hypothetical protein
MIRAILALLLALCALPASAAEPVEATKDMVLLTVSGAIEQSNRGPFDAGKDSLLALQKISFSRAVAFDRAMLLGLKQGTVTAQPPEFQAPANFTGPLLKDVLAAVGAARAKVTYMAVDGYTGWLNPEDIDASDWVLALAADGVPLGVGQQGPLWLINTRGPGERASDTHRGHWVWALFYMKVGD